MYRQVGTKQWSSFMLHYSWSMSDRFLLVLFFPKAKGVCVCICLGGGEGTVEEIMWNISSILWCSFFTFKFLKPGCCLQLMGTFNMVEFCLVCLGSFPVWLLLNLLHILQSMVFYNWRKMAYELHTVYRTRMSFPKESFSSRFSSCDSLTLPRGGSFICLFLYSQLYFVSS